MVVLGNRSTRGGSPGRNPTDHGRLSVGLLGVGNIGSVHLQSAQRIDGIEVTAVADARAENRQLASRLGVDRTYPDFRELLDAEPVDVVIVALPPFLHEKAVTRSVEAGCHVFVEKPFAVTTDEAAEMVRAADRADRFIGVDHTIRYQPEFRRMKEAVDEGRLGHVPLTFISRVNNGPFGPPFADQAIPDWQLDPASTGGGALVDLGVHLFDVLEWFFGEMGVRHAEMGRQLNLPYEDTAVVILKAKDQRTVATLTCGFFQWERPPKVNTYFRLDGIADSLENRTFVPDSLVQHAASSAAKNVWKRLRGDSPAYFEPTYYYQAHFEALRAFIDAVLANRQPPVDGTAGLRTMQLVEESYAAADFDPRELGVDA